MEIIQCICLKFCSVSFHVTVPLDVISILKSLENVLFRKFCFSFVDLSGIVVVVLEASVLNIKIHYHISGVCEGSREISQQKGIQG